MVILWHYCLLRHKESLVLGVASWRDANKYVKLYTLIGCPPEHPRIGEISEWDRKKKMTTNVP